MQKWIFGVFLSVAAGQDLRKKKVDVWVYLVFGSFALSSWFYEFLSVPESKRIWEIFLKLCPGMMLLGISSISRGGIGIGDGCFFLISGLLLSVRNNLVLLCWGIMLCGMYSFGYLMWIRMKRRSFRKAGGEVVPFLPFLVPFGIWMICSGGV